MGQDCQFQPVIVIGIAALKLSSESRFDAIDALTFAFMVARKYMCRPGVIEQCSLIIDLEDVGMLSFPMQEVKYISQQLFKHFPCFVDRLYICNASSAVRLLSKAFNCRRL